MSYQKKRCAFCDKPFDPSNGRARFCSVKCRNEQHAFLAKNTRSRRIEAKKLELEKQPFELRHCIEDAITVTE